MLTWKDVLVAEEVRNGKLIVAERARMLRTDNRGRGRQAGLAARWLYALGELLVTWGCRLQSRNQRVISKRPVAAAQGATLLLEGSSGQKC